MRARILGKRERTRIYPRIGPQPNASGSNQREFRIGGPTTLISIYVTKYSFHQFSQNYPETSGHLTLQAVRSGYFICTEQNAPFACVFLVTIDTNVTTDFSLQESFDQSDFNEHSGKSNELMATCRVQPNGKTVENSFLVKDCRKHSLNSTYDGV